MISEEVLLEKIKVLPPNLKQKALDYVEALQKRAVPSQERKSYKGALAHLNIKFTEQDLREARNEMWRGYTKDTENEK